MINDLSWRSIPWRPTGLTPKACPDCFAHPWLREYVATHSTGAGTCPSCRRRARPLIPVARLYNPFETLLSSYQLAEGPPMEHGTPIVALIQDDWEVFSERLIESGREGVLLESIMATGWDDDDGLPLLCASDPYVARHRRWSHDTLDEIWEEFAEQVKADPSYPLEFRDPDFDAFLLHEDLAGRRTAREPAGKIFYRARLGAVRGPSGAKPYAGSDIGAPPPERADPGRANAKGRVVLYCADQEHTAIGEKRPANGEYVSVAEVRARKELHLLDIATEPEWPNPFTNEAVNYEVEFASLLVAFGEELAKPLRYRDDPTDYIPSQKLAELIERMGMDGIRYPSAMAPGGTNVVLFDPSVIEVGDSRLIEIVQTTVEYRDAKDR